MDITQLPEEIIITIIRKLDMQSQRCLYYSCKQMKNIISSNAAIRVCNLTVNDAINDMLKCSFFKNISGHLCQLNLRGVYNLVVEPILIAMVHLKRLETLDISYTNLTIIDFLNIHVMRPTLRNISINLTFPSRAFAPDTFLQCQLVFGQFKNVHFVGSIRCSIDKTFKMGFYLLQKAKLNSLKFTLTKISPLCFSNCAMQYGQLPQFDNLSIYFSIFEFDNYYGWMNGVMDGTAYWLAPVLDQLNSQKYEMIVIVMTNAYTYKVYATSLFQGFFRESLNLEADRITGTPLLGDIAMMVWNKETTVFNENFFHKLKNQLDIFN